jgi:hypothetical protein
MYRYGYQTGHEDILNKRTFVVASSFLYRVYYVSEIVPVRPTKGGGVVIDFDSLMDDLKREVLPNTWDDKGGLATMAEFPTNISIVISHDQDGHDRIAAWMKRRRQQALRSGTPTVGSLAKKTPPLRK